MHLPPITLRFAFLCSLALMASGSPLHACSGDQYWDADPEGTLTWFTRGPEIAMNLPLPKVIETARNALHNAGLRICDSEKDLFSQKVKVVRAFQIEAVNTPIKDGFRAPIQDYSQVMLRIIDRGGDRYAVQILTRTKWGRGRGRPSIVADQEPLCAASAIANRVRSHLPPTSK